jgi:deazaflavin-dependent oxidoreductase (nitroreductase family)
VDLSAVADEEFCYLTTTGRVTGRPHTIEIWFAVAGGRVYLLSGGGDRSDWVRNLLADPRVVLRVGGQEGPATAGLVADAAEEATARRLLAAKYQDWSEGEPLSGWATTALLVALDPVEG